MTWLRLEGATRDPEIAEGLAAHIADPLWTLARQWQVGEFHGEDAASPVMVTADVAHAPLTAFAAGAAGPIVGRADADRPLEVLVEQEPVDDDALLTFELGWVLLRALARAGAPAALRDRLRGLHPPVLPPDDGLDPAGRARLEVTASRSLDGFSLSRAITAAGGARRFATGLGLAPNVASMLERALAGWTDVVASFVRLPSTGASWQDADLEYQFRVAAPAGAKELGFSACEYRGGTLDWYHFRRTPDAPPLGAAGSADVHRVTVLPAPLRFHGMPAARFWEIEDHSVSFGDLAGGEEDLVRSIVGGFAATYADDWLVIPCVLRAGTVARVERLVVHDDFGRAVPIPATAVLDGPGRIWRFFEVQDDDGPNAPSAADRKAPLLLLAPALPDTEQGPPLERVDFIRDGVNNVAWAIERMALSAAGAPIDRAAMARSAGTAVAEGADWRYEAFRPPPEHWIPLVPVRIGDGAEVHLRRGRLAVTEPGIPPESRLPLGRILDAGKPLRIHEEAIPDAGLRIDRRYQRTRSADGRIHLWVGRRTRWGTEPDRVGAVADQLVKPQQVGS